MHHGLDSQSHSHSRLSLESALAEGATQLDPTSTTAIRLMAAALAKLAEQMGEFRRCASARAARLTAFCECSLIEDVLTTVFAAASDSGYEGPRRAEFLSIHLCLVRSGLLQRAEGGNSLATFPFCYGSPPYVRSARGYGSKKLDDGKGRSGDGSVAPTPELVPWDEGMRLWPLLVELGCIEGGRL